MQAAIEWSIIVSVLTIILIASFFYDASERDKKVAAHAKDIQKQVEDYGAKHDIKLENFVLTPEGVIFTEDFNDSSVVKFAGVELCQEGAEPNPGYTSSYSCHESQCATLLDFGEKQIPNDVTIHRKYNGACVSQTLQNIKPYQVYTKDLVFNATVEKRLEATEGEKVEKTAHSKFSEAVVKREGKNMVIVLEYQTERPPEDEFKLGTKEVQLIYNLKPARHPL